MSDESLRSRKKAQVQELEERELQEEILIELKLQNGLQRQATHYLKRINLKIQIFFWIFVAYVIFATVILFTGKV